MADQRLAEHVRTRVNNARVERQWSAIAAAGLPGPARGRSRRAIWLAALGSVACAGAIAAAFLLRPAAGGLPSGAMIESAQAEVAVRLEDGSRVQLAPKSQLRLLANAPSAIALELRSGTARFDVTHVPGRSFAVKAGTAEVSVIGTRFALTRQPEAGFVRVRVAVSEGTVEVRRADAPGQEPQRIHAGESWSARLSEPGAVAQAPTPAPEAADEVSDTPEEPALLAQESAEPSELEAKRLLEPESAERRGARHRRAQSVRAAEPGAAEVFLRGNLARRAGRMGEAAEAYASLLASYPEDARAGLAAFELGRIRMDALGDASGAIRALERSLTAGPAASFHEDALARIVVAQDALGRTQACAQARDRYLAAYPGGVHAHALAARCR